MKVLHESWNACAAAALVRRHVPHEGPRANAPWLLAQGSVEILLLEWPNEVAGMLALHEGKAYIGLNSRHPFGRRHFTFWHEVGHWLLHTGRFKEAARADPSRFLGCMAGGTLSLPEQEANIFAAHVLMPSTWVRRLYGVSPDARSLARAFAVTPRAMQRRLWELGLARARS